MQVKPLKEKVKNFLARLKSTCSESHILFTGKMMYNQIKTLKGLHRISEAELKVFAQFGDDEIIRWLIHNIDLPNKTFVEFRVENYREPNTRF